MIGCAKRVLNFGELHIKGIERKKTTAEEGTKDEQKDRRQRAT
tara:strand:- start:17 stop:145 length:129 start_codon:yes stop_codon:yes gene_type:complete